MAQNNPVVGSNKQRFTGTGPFVIHVIVFHMA